MSPVPPVLAAGAVCWREGADGAVEILLVHRTQHRDTSLPKGKVDPGETLPETAVREIAEETGLRIGLGVPLGVSTYALGSGRDKIVHFWAAEVSERAIELLARPQTPHSRRLRRLDRCHRRQG